MCDRADAGGEVRGGDESKRRSHNCDRLFFSVWVDSDKLCCFLTLKNLKILSINWEGIVKKM